MLTRRRHSRNVKRWTAAGTTRRLTACQRAMVSFSPKWNVITCFLIHNALCITSPNFYGLVAVSIVGPDGAECGVDIDDKVLCGYLSSDDCVAEGCCYYPSSGPTGTPYCYCKTSGISLSDLEYRINDIMFLFRMNHRCV